MSRSIRFFKATRIDSHCTSLYNLQLFSRTGPLWFAVKKGAAMGF
jgi:hypothetical protein